MKDSTAYKFIDKLVQNFKHRGICTFKYGAHASHGSIFEGMNMIGKDTKFRGHLGYGSYIGDGCNLNANIGRFSSIAPKVSCNPGTHPYKEPFVSTSPLFFQSKHMKGKSFATKNMIDLFRYKDQKKKISIEIGNDCWIGEGVFFVGGITVNDGAVVMANATVTKDVEPYSIVGGVPAKIIGYRYDKETIDMLLSVKWWNMEIEWIKKHWELMTDMSKFKSYFSNKK